MILLLWWYLLPDFIDESAYSKYKEYHCIISDII